MIIKDNAKYNNTMEECMGWTEQRAGIELILCRAGAIRGGFSDLSLKRNYTTGGGSISAFQRKYSRENSFYSKLEFLIIRLDNKT